jgi:hypothetical protein
MILSVLLLFLYVAVAVVKRSVRFGAFRDPRDLHLFFLGAGFMLLETKGVTELSLLFGSTWVVNAAVIAGFLLMGALANLLVASVTTAIPWNWVYAILFLLLFAGMFFPYSALTAFSGIKKIGTAVILVGLPALCSGVLFSRSFNDTADPARGLGINLLGTVVGGMLVLPSWGCWASRYMEYLRWDCTAHYQNNLSYSAPRRKTKPPDDMLQPLAIKEIFRKVRQRTSLDGAGSSNTALLFLVSFAALYLEMLLIRWVGTEFRLFAYFQNLALIACFLGRTEVLDRRWNRPREFIEPGCIDLVSAGEL